ncbi:MAG: oligopeptide transporter, OPT family [candidate division Zixibacteria bacterium]|nr:oligopeptide transporter, OPT family [candidate division Zixibacteria bacterium]MBU1472119.1 oligopeptide transporter, OPT family [candidate division Zixibacteria bacterium]MBU2626238.1 oligopeptide transporter, OPT family [candidate division Zixibacteria bacterium]
MAKEQVQTEGDLYQPFVPASKTVPEITVSSVVLGIIISIVFGMANAYLGLKLGMTISASIPAAVISMAVLRAILKRGSVLENNMVQTIGSAGESLVAGVIFTIPAFLIWSETIPGFDDVFQLTGADIVAMSLLGGSLGIFMMIPLRKYLVHREHNKLRFPEGTACAEIILAGDEGGSKAVTVFSGIGIGALYKIVMSGCRGWLESPGFDFRSKPLDGATLGIDATPALLGVGYIIGPRIAALMLSGAVLGYIGLAPAIKFLGAYFQADYVPMAVSEMSSGDLRNYFIKYFGVGAVALGGFVSLIKAAPVIFHSFAVGFRQLTKRGAGANEKPIRTDEDMPMWQVLLGTLLVVIAIWIMPGLDLHLLSIALVVLFGFFFVVVAARIVGIVGSSSSPVSGMTIATLLVTCLILISFGVSGMTGMVTAMTIGAIVCIAVCMSGDIAQDLKTGWLLGATPKKQQWMEFVGLAASAVTMGGVVFLLANAYGFVQSPEHPSPLLAPQANVMATVVQGIMGGQLPWEFIVGGCMIAAAVELLGISSLPFAIGLYLPLSLSTPIMAGGLIALLVKKTSPKDIFKRREQKGILFGSGLVAGDALVGVLIAFAFAGADYVSILDKYKSFSEHYESTSILGLVPGSVVALCAFAALILTFWLFTKVRKDRS